MVLVHPYLAQLPNIKHVDEPLREEKFLVTGLNFQNMTLLLTQSRIFIFDIQL